MLDNAVKTAAEYLNTKIIEEKAQNISVGQFTYRGVVPSMGHYWTNQLIEELVNITNRSFNVLAGGPAGADYTISGEIVDLADTVRVYARLVRSETRAIQGAFHSDFERNRQVIQMLSTGGSVGSSSVSASSDSEDQWEPDSRDNPVPYDIGMNENVPVMERYIREGDEDFFLLIPSGDGRLVMETTGNMDTVMELYDDETGRKITENDDGGDSLNALIRHAVLAGRRYVVKVKAYSSSGSGSYGFRAYLRTQESFSPDEYEPDDDSDSASVIEIGTPQAHNFHDEDDVDWVKFEVTESGRYIIRARGVNSNSLDTYIELFDANLNSIAENDDGGERLDSRLSRQLSSGFYYLKVWCLDEEPDQPYTISIERER